MLGKTSEYAIRALVYILIQNQDGKRPGFREIAENIDSPGQFTAKILQGLTRMGLVASAKGRGGGFFFRDPAAPLTLFRVIQVTEGDGFFTRCGFGLTRCDKEHPCPLHNDYSVIRDKYYRLVTRETIQSLARKINNREAVLTRK